MLSIISTAHQVIVSRPFTDVQEDVSVWEWGGGGKEEREAQSACLEKSPL